VAIAAGSARLEHPQAERLLARTQQIFSHATNLAIVSQTFSLNHGDVRLRIVRTRDVKVLESLILGNRSWLRPWEATHPQAPNSFDIRSGVRGLLRAMDRNEGLPFVIEFQGRIVGQLNVANMLYGSVSSAVIGYWVTPDVAGKGITPTAVALVSDYLFRVVGIHRVEIAIRPENEASLRIVEKLGFRFEGLKERYIHINGAWRDHYIFALTEEEIEDSVLGRWLSKQVPKLQYPWTGKAPKKNEHATINE
jgi:ribosomal-protein-alanine N-acetyltransferase